MFILTLKNKLCYITNLYNIKVSIPKMIMTAPENHFTLMTKNHDLNFGKLPIQKKERNGISKRHELNLHFIHVKSFGEEAIMNFVVAKLHIIWTVLKKTNQPFFMYCAYRAPHQPFSHIKNYD